MIDHDGLTTRDYLKMCADFREHYFPQWEERWAKMIGAFADYEAATQERIDQENIEILVKEMEWTREDATAFVNEKPAEGENHDRRRNRQNLPTGMDKRLSTGRG